MKIKFKSQKYRIEYEHLVPLDASMNIFSFVHDNLKNEIDFYISEVSEPLWDHLIDKLGRSFLIKYRNRFGKK